MLDKNASLEDEYAKAAAFKPLLDSYKSKVDTLETKSAALQRDMEGLKLELDRAKEAARKAEEERQRGAETLLAFEERVQELEATGPASTKMRRSDTGTSVDEAEAGGLGLELDDAMGGATMTDLKLRIRRLERELKRTGTNDEAGSPAVMQDLLDEANRLKDKYQQDYLAEHREKLVLGARLDEIASGKSRLGDG